MAFLPKGVAEKIAKAKSAPLKRRIRGQPYLPIALPRDWDSEVKKLMGTMSLKGRRTRRPRSAACSMISDGPTNRSPGFAGGAPAYARRTSR
jgi:hypothetical protein